MEDQLAPVLTCVKAPALEGEVAAGRIPTHREEAAGRIFHSVPGVSGETDLLERLAACGSELDRLQRESRRCLAEISALRAENRWDDILSLFHPVEEKNPELAAAGLATPLRSEMAFILGHVDRFEEAITQYEICVAEDPENFHFHSGLAYSAYNSLYGAKNRQVALHPAEKRERIELAHQHFTAAQALRPEGVTNAYRQGMLYKQIQAKRDKALPLFQKAVSNWTAYPEEKKRERHQERKNYVKALYHLASCHLHEGNPREALRTLQQCLGEDESSGHVSIVHKYYALGKTQFELGQYGQAIQALGMAAGTADPTHDDFVFELLARTFLARNDLEKAWASLSRIPVQRRRPYVRWTEADILVAQGRPDQACRILKEAAERDRRGRHKALIRLARLHFSGHRYTECLQSAQQANSFFQSSYQNSYDAALFWEAAALLRLQRHEEAKQKAHVLGSFHPGYPHLGKLRQLLKGSQPQGTKDGEQ